MTWTVFGVQVLLPVCAIGLIALAPMQRSARVLWAAGLAGILLASERIVLWHVPPIWVVWIYLALLVVALLIGWRRPPRSNRYPVWLRWLSLGAAGVGAVAGVGLLALVLAEDSGPPASLALVELSAPLAPGHYLVAHGGASQLVNAHTAFVANAAKGPEYAGQAFAIDFLGLGPLWLTGPLVGHGVASDYPIWGTPVLAPCAGVVIATSDGQADMPPPVRDRARLTGNHVLLDCGGVHVLLAHLMRASVKVARGDRLEGGTQVGLVGNSGNTTQPHLHLHVQYPGTQDAPLSGAPLPFTVNGRWLVRNDRIRF